MNRDEVEPIESSEAETVESASGSLRERIEAYLHSSDLQNRRHVHPKLVKMFELAGMNAAFVRAQDQYMWDAEGNRYLDFLGGGGVYLMGRNQPSIHRAIGEVLSMNLPNMTVVNAAVLSGMVAEKLLEIGGKQFSKVVFANSGTECTEVALRFARNVTLRRRFLYLEGAFHGRTYAAMSCCGSEALRSGIDPAMPTCTPVKAGNIAQLRRELRMGDVAGFIFEPVQGMTGEAVDAGYLREAEALCKEHGTVLIADEVQTGLGRTGAWFATREMGVRPQILTCSKALSGGAVPVGAVLVDESIYNKVYAGFSSGLNHFSTFAEGNLAMAAALSTLEFLEAIDAPRLAKDKGQYLRDGLLDIADKYDCIDHVAGKGLMITIYFKDSGSPALLAQQKALSAADAGAFAAAVNVDMYKRQRILVQIPGPHVNAVKILPPATSTQEDLDYFLGSFEDTIARFYGRQGPAVQLVSGVASGVAKQLPLGSIPPLQRALGLPDPAAEKKNPELRGLTAPPRAPAGQVLEFADYDAPLRFTTDYLVVGSGPGGTCAALSLAQEGAQVVMLEAGPRLTRKDFGQNIGHMLASYFWDGATRSVRGNVMFPTLQVRALGGGTVFNSAICMRPTETALENWRDDHGLSEMTSDMLAPYFDAVESFLHITEADDAVMGRRNELFREACEALDWSWDRIKRFEEGCTGSGECLTGCRTGAKLTLDRRGVPELVEAGGRVYTSVHVDKLIVEHGRVRGVEGFTICPDTHQRTHPVRILAGCTVMSAGAIGSPAILRRSGLTSEPVGSQLRFHPSCYIMGVFDEEVNPWFGATQGIHSSQHLERGIKLEALWATASTFSRGLPTRPKTFKRYLRRWPKMAVFDGWVSGDNSVGEVRVLPGGRPDLRWNMGDSDAARLQEANALLCDMFAAVHAKEVFTGLVGFPDVMDPAEASSRIRETPLDRKEMPTASNHVFGGMPMGANDKRAACDGWGQVYGVDDLYVADTSLYPSSPAVNPQLTAMALAWRLGKELPNRY